jgi:uncharacterized membrane protein YeaQ/YmgE (transglycosylase-associated protein family)
MRNIIFAVVDEFNVPRAGFNDDSVGNILKIVFGVIGAVALVVLLLASLKYVTSRGDPNEVAKAKNSIIYAVIGLVVVASAFAIVSFVVDKV